MVAPLLWMFSTSIKTKEDVFALPPVWIPETISFSKYTEIWEMGPLLSGISNSLIVAVTVTVIGTFTSSLAAFAFAKLKFPGRNNIFIMLFASVMIPYPVVMIPQFIMFSSIGWVDTLLPLIVPGLFGNIFMIFFLRQYLTSVPNSIIEAAKIDGCSYFQIFYKIIFPLIKPAVAAQLILWFMGIWNDYLGPILYLNSPEKQTLQLVIANFNASYAIQSDYPLIMAASVVALLPMLIVFIIFQKQIIESIAISGVKG
ncbi:carbohydrate ABC transporter permease [Cytobacillus oceanisediminis]|nr:carbohydrate ABC transporter permease [Cytobacillus oceanisediminis]